MKYTKEQSTRQLEQEAYKLNPKETENLNSYYYGDFNNRTGDMGICAYERNLKKIIENAKENPVKVYIVSQICDDEYFCTDVLFVTDDEKFAKQYCKKYNVKNIGWDGVTRDTITYKEYSLLKGTEKDEEVDY